MEFRVALIDDHALLRGAIAQVLSADPGLPTLQVMQVNSLAKLQPSFDAGLTIDLLMVDLGLPDLGGLLGIAGIRNAYPTIPVIVMSDSDGKALIEDCAKPGAAGFLHKPGSVDRIRQSVRSVLGAEYWLNNSFDERRPGARRA